MSEVHPDAAARLTHWETIYEARDPTSVSWYEPVPTTSLRMLDSLAVGPDDSIIDVGGGASHLVDHLLERGHHDVTVLDIAQSALHTAAQRLGADPRVTWLHQDLLVWQPERQFDVWHDRAVFHFLVDPADRDRYLSLMRSTLAEDGRVVLATFNADGPDHCSGLPVCRYSPDDLASLLQVSFEIVTATSQSHTAPSGMAQSFTWVAARRR